MFSTVLFFFKHDFSVFVMIKHFTFSFILQLTFLNVNFGICCVLLNSNLLGY